MDCQEVQGMLSAAQDGELPAGEAARLEEHLAGCPACQAVRAGLTWQDRTLRSQLQGRRSVAAVMERVHRQLHLQPVPGRRWPRWLPVAAAAAAGFLAACLVFQPWRSPRPVLVWPSPQDQARQVVDPLLLAVAREPVDVQSPGGMEWRPLLAGGRFAMGSRIRTRPNARCEIVTTDASLVRVNGGSELCFEADRRVQLATGQMMARVVPGRSPFQVQIDESLVTALGTEFDIARKPGETVLMVLDGSTRLEGTGQSLEVNSGEVARIVAGRATEKSRIDPMLLMLTTRWVNEILVLKGHDNPELGRRIDDVLAQLGQLKGNFMEEQEIRALGDRCVLPLTRYLQSPRSQGEDQQPRRVLAARILADLAQPWSIPDLLQLLNHDDSEVRFCAARALERLTGQNQGHRPEDWRRGSLASMAPTQKLWQAWWGEHKHQYPGIP